MICPKHNKELRVGKSGRLFCPTPITRSADGKRVLEWCQYNPTNAPANTQPVSLPEAPATPQKGLETREPVIEPRVDPKVWVEKDLRIAREAALHTASRNHMGKEVDPALLILEANEFVKYIYHGLASDEDIDIELPSETVKEV